MADDLGVFLDTSVLIGGVIELGPASVAAQRILAAVADGRLPRPMTAWHCCLEFYSVTTRLPPEFRLTPEMAARLLEDEILERFEVHGLPARSRLGFVRSLAGDAIVGGRVYDTHIGDVARRAGATRIVTDNRRHFISLLRHGVRVHSADEFAHDQRL